MGGGKPALSTSSILISLLGCFLELTLLDLGTDAARKQAGSKRIRYKLGFLCPRQHHGEHIYTRLLLNHEILSFL